MIIFIIYFITIGFLIYKTGLFGLLRDPVLKPAFYLGAFIVKGIGIFIFYLVYKVFYGSLDYGDTYNFMHDSRIIHDVAKWNFTEFLKVMLGLQDESETTELYRHFIKNTSIWNKNPNELLYNDNRIVIRLHALFHFISFHSYFVHSLFGSTMSLIGINWIYKAFKGLFPGKEVLLFSVWLLFPGTLFWTSGVLKEAPALFFMGLLLIGVKKVILERQFSFKVVVGFFAGVTICFFFKHYTFLPLLGLSLLFFTLVTFRIKNISLIYIFSIVILFVIGNIVFSYAFGRSILKVISERQFAFQDMSKGGIFLSDSTRVLRLPYDPKLIVIDSSSAGITATIKKGAHFIYSENSHAQDTLECRFNADTITKFNFDYFIVPANATFNAPAIRDNYFSFLKALPFALYVTTLKPFFFDARNTLDILASIENVIMVFALVIILLFGFRQKKNIRWLTYFLSLAFVILIIIGLTSPNAGAIVRYRCIVVPFILMCSLMSLNFHEGGSLFKLLKRSVSE